MYLTEIDKYRDNGSTDEWYISKLLDNCVAELGPEQAFQEISGVFEALLDEKEWDIFLNHCQYILRLARMANTTELPEKLVPNINAIRVKAKDLDLEKHTEVQEIYAWFRI